MKCIEKTNPESLVQVLVEEISSKIERSIPVLFLVSGGSTAQLAVQICKTLNKRLAGKTGGLKWLMTFTLADERYGEIGHSDSNWQLLLNSGFLPQNFTTVPILQKDSGYPENMEDLETFDNSGDLKTIEETVLQFNDFLSDAVKRAQNNKLYIVGLFGIGEDGHTAGILPNSPAACLPPYGETYATGFKSSPFTRITIAPAFFNHINLATVWAGGEAKKPALKALFTEGSAEEVPARYLSLAKKTLIYTDQHITIGE